MELLDVYNKNGETTGRVIKRGDKNLNENEFIKLAVIWVKAQNKYLIQKCSEEKGGEFAVSGGHVSSGNDSFKQIIIECQEELGLNLKKDKIKFLGSVIKQHAIFDVFLYEDDNLIDYNFSLQKSEVESISWKTVDEIVSLINQENFRKSSALHFEKFIKH